MTNTETNEVKNLMGEKATEAGHAPGEEKKPYVPEKKSETSFKAKESMMLALAIVGTLGIILWTHFLPKTPASTQPFEGKQTVSQATTQGSGATSTVPMTELHASNADRSDDGLANADMIDHTGKQEIAEVQQGNAKKLGDVKQFDSQGNGSVDTYDGDAQPSDNDSRRSESKSEREELGQPSLVFIRNDVPSNTSQKSGHEASERLEIGLGLPPGSRLRAHLAAAVNTAVQTPVVAVVDYNYVRNGEIVVPAGSKVFGRLDAADRSGYLSVRFESVLFPSGESVNIQATATDLKLRPLRGKTEGKNGFTRVLITSVTGIGGVAATVLGAGNLNQPLNQASLVKSRMAENVGQASDNQVAQLAMTEHVVVSIPANTGIYVVLQKRAATPRDATAIGQTSANAKRPQSVEDLQQLIQLQKELGESASQDGSK